MYLFEGQAERSATIKRQLFENLLATAKQLYLSTPALTTFTDWPKDLAYIDRNIVAVPALRQIKRWSNEHALHVATQQVADYAQWNQTYTEDEVGFGFLQDYGYIELYGPNGHYYSKQGRAYIGYWGRGLHYPWHRHKAEEIYAVVSGSGFFESEADEPAFLGSGDTRAHYSNQPHALTMRDGPILTFVLWRGAGVAERPSMSKRY